MDRSSSLPTIKHIHDCFIIEQLFICINGRQHNDSFLLRSIPASHAHKYPSLSDSAYGIHNHLAGLLDWGVCLVKLCALAVFQYLDFVLVCLITVTVCMIVMAVHIDIL